MEMVFIQAEDMRLFYFLPCFYVESSSIFYSLTYVRGRVGEFQFDVCLRMTHTLTIPR